MMLNRVSGWLLFPPRLRSENPAEGLEFQTPWDECAAEGPGTGGTNPAAVYMLASMPFQPQLHPSELPQFMHL